MSFNEHEHRAELLADAKRESLKEKLPKANAKEKAIASQAKQRGTRNREMWS